MSENGMSEIRTSICLDFDMIRILDVDCKQNLTYSTKQWRSRIFALRVQIDKIVKKHSQNKCICIYNSTKHINLNQL